MTSERTAGGVRITTHSLWRIRLARDLFRYSLWVLAAAGLAASARYAIAPPRPVITRSADATRAPEDLAAEGYAALFARRYLTWNAADPQASALALEPFAGPGIEPNAGLELPAAGEQHVEWAEVVQQRETAPGDHVYTVAAQTDTAGLLYLTVSVMRDPEGSLALFGYPALVGAPTLSPAEPSRHRREVTEPALSMVVERALRNYLAASQSELAADLTPGARVSLPAMPLSLASMERLDWSEQGSAVLAVVQAQDTRGLRYTLAYELDVTREQGRWEISAVQMDPDS